jgi:hypothetical protein
MTNMHRRTFLAAAGITALAHGRTVSAPLRFSSEPLQLTGNGEWTYRLRQSEIIVLPPRDPMLKSAASTESALGCLIQEAFSQLAPNSRSGAGARNSLPKGPRNNKFPVMGLTPTSRATQ